MPRVRRLLQFTDLHLFPNHEETLRGISTNSSFEATLHAARRDLAATDAILLTGDIAQDTQPETYAWLRDRLRPLALRVHAVAGNHDEPHLIDEFFAEPPLSSARVLMLEPWVVLLLDTRLPGEVGGRVGPAQLAWLDGQLRAHADRHVLIGLHHQPLPVGSAWIDAIGLGDAASLWETLARHGNVRGMCCGHVHQQAEFERRGIRCLVTPSTGRQFKPGIDEFAIDSRPPGYRSIRLYANGRIRSHVSWCN